MRDDPQAVENLKTLVLKTSLLLLKHRHTAYSLSEDNVTTGTEVLNCVRILTRMLPYVYESDALRQWEDACFWERQDIRELRKFASDIAEYFDDQESLGVQVVQALVELLFYTGFTLPWPDSDTQQGRKGTVSYGLWQSGIACDTTVVTSKEFECRRTEILQLLLTLESKSIYISPSMVADLELWSHTLTKIRRIHILDGRFCAVYRPVERQEKSAGLALLPAQHGTMCRHHQQIFADTCLR